MNPRYKGYFRFFFPIHFIFEPFERPTTRSLRFHEPLGKVPADFSRVDCFKGFSAGWRSDAAGWKRTKSRDRGYSRGRSAARDFNTFPSKIHFAKNRVTSRFRCFDITHSVIADRHARRFFSLARAFFWYPVKICECILVNKSRSASLFRVYFLFVWQRKCQNATLQFLKFPDFIASIINDWIKSESTWEQFYSAGESHCPKKTSIWQCLHRII